MEQYNRNNREAANGRGKDDADDDGSDDNSDSS